MSRNFDILEQTGQGKDLFETAPRFVERPAPATVAAPAAPAAAASAVRRAATLPGRIVPQAGPHTLPSKPALPRAWTDWMRWMREAARHWRDSLRSQDGQPQANADLITREEEIKLVHRVFYPPQGRSPQVVMFCGAETDAGSAAICSHASELLAAQPDEAVCLVDANLRSPRLHQYFGLENRKGLAEAVAGSGPVQDYAQRVADRNLWVMPGGQAESPLSLTLAAHRVQARINELRGEFKRVVLYSSPLGADTDPLLLSRWTDGVVLVVEAHATRREAARRVKENLEVAGVGVLGVVLSNRTYPIPEALYRRV